MTAGLCAVLGVTHCDYTAYPLAPTFCDDWCKALRRVPCDEEPENCVRDCERSRPSAACAELRVELKECYEATPALGFVCAGEGFGQEVRPLNSTCPTERDALIGCEYPEVLSCLDVCRQFKAEYATAHRSERCPDADMPCDALCWELREPQPNSPIESGAQDAATTTTDTLQELALCVLQQALSCHSSPPSNQEPAQTWSTVLVGCLQELGIEIPD